MAVYIADVIARAEYDRLEKEYYHYKRLAEQDGDLRLKLDKAIEEINDMAYIGFCAEPLGNKVLVFKDDVLEILKRNIGE